jgi:hypothetical protein
MLYCTILYLLWIAMGTSFFMIYFGWNFGTAYYLAMGTGLNIGPCEPAHINTETVMIFQMFYFLLGSSVIAGAFGFFFDTITRTKAVLFNHNWNDVSIYEAKQNDSDVANRITLTSLFKYVWTKIKVYSGWYTSRSRTLCVFLFIIWMGWATLFGIFYLGLDLTTSLYWVLGTASSAGFYAPECINGTHGFSCGEQKFA